MRKYQQISIFEMARLLLHKYAKSVYRRDTMRKIAIYSKDGVAKIDGNADSGRDARQGGPHLRVLIQQVYIGETADKKY